MQTKTTTMTKKIRDLEFIGSDPGLDDLMGDEGLHYPYEWRFLPSGKVRHAVNWAGMFPSAVAVCGQDVISGILWMGSGSWQESVTLSGLPNCKNCVRMLKLED